jgi:hypothetical protein
MREYPTVPVAFYMFNVSDCTGKRKGKSSFVYCTENRRSLTYFTDGGHCDIQKTSETNLETNHCEPVTSEKLDFERDIGSQKPVSSTFTGSLVGNQMYGTIFLRHPVCSDHEQPIPNNHQYS